MIVWSRRPLLFPPLINAGTSLLFPFSCVFPYSNLHSRVCFSELPFSDLCFLASPSCCFFFFDSSMVESVEREHLEKVSSFVGKDCLYTFVLSSLFPLVSHSAEVAKLLRMSEVRSSNLETTLSSSDDRVVSEATFVSAPYKCWNISCSFMGKDKQWIRDRFQFPDFVKFRILSDEERAFYSYANEVCFYEADFTSGFHFLVHPFIKELFSYLHLALAQLVPNSWQILISCMVVWMSANNGDVIKREKFLHFYRLRKSKDSGYYEFKPWDRASRLILYYPSSL